MDRSNYQDISEEFSFKLSFKADKPNGILLFIGDKDSQDYAMLELRNNYLTYVFNLGGGAVNLEDPHPILLDSWVSVELTVEDSCSRNFKDFQLFLIENP